MRIMNTRCACLLLLCLVPLAVYHFTNWRPVEAEIRLEKELLLENVFAALLKAVEFLSSDYMDMNVDGLCGFRICQGSLIGTLHDCSFEKLRCPETLRYKLMSIIGRLNELCYRALLYIEQKDTEYYRNYLPVLEAPFMVNYIPEKWHQFPKHDTQSEKTYNRELGDTCFRAIIGTFSHRGRKFPPCTIVDGCCAMVTTRGTSGYFTTHQLLYLLFGEQSRCEQQLNSRLFNDTGMSLKDVQRHLCEQIYIDAMFREKNRTSEKTAEETAEETVEETAEETAEETVEETAEETAEDTAEDLFLEQSVLCGILGFENFFNESWINMVLEWQGTSGCFTQTSHKINDEDIDEIKAETSKEEDTFNTVTGRCLMAESVMNGDCLSHKTGLGAAALGAYVRYLVSELHTKV